MPNGLRSTKSGARTVCPFTDTEQCKSDEAESGGIKKGPIDDIRSIDSRADACAASRRCLAEVCKSSLHELTASMHQPLPAPGAHPASIGMPGRLSWAVGYFKKESGSISALLPVTITAMLTHRHVSNLVQITRKTAVGSAVSANGDSPARPSGDRHEVWLHQFVQLFDRQAWIPLSIGCIAANARANEAFNASFEVQPLVYMREEPDAIVGRYSNPAILGFSTYIWNVRLSLACARLAKARFPACLIVFGGPSAPAEPKAAEEFLRAHPYVDIIVANEGETAFLDLCLAQASGAPPDAITGLHFLRDGAYIQTGPGRFTKDMDELASPYLTGIFDELMAGPIQFHAIWETDRGCPFKCGFCYWGDDTRGVKARVGLDRLEGEMDWFIQHEIELLYIADSNFGWLDRNKIVARGLAERALEHGFPKKVMLTWAKNANEKVFETAQILNTAGLCYPITMSYQSLDAEALRNIQRSNIALPRTKELRTKYVANNMSTYTDLLIGIPGETVTSFLNGMEDVVAYGEHDQIQVYPIRMLPNTDMARAEYIEKHRIKTVWVPLLTKHGGLVESDPVQEMEEIIVETATMSSGDWKRQLEATWFIQSFFCLKSAYFVCLFLNVHLGARIVDFGVYFLERLRRGIDLPLLKREIQRVDRFVASFLEGRPAVDTSDLDLPAVQWPIEEATFIALALSRDAFYRELRVIVDEFVRTQGKACEAELLDEVFAYQRARVVNPAGPAQTELFFEWDLPAFFGAAMHLEPIALVRESATMHLHANVAYSTLHDFARFHVWYGRQGKRFYYDATSGSMAAAGQMITAATPSSARAAGVAVPTIST